MKVHLKGFDTLRAIAALLVVVNHIELIKERKNMSNFSSFLPDGHLSVILFFALSGFLITFLLMKEFEEKKSISLKNFYLRRLLRIWPLYYLVLISSMVLIPLKHSLLSYLLCFTTFPNIAKILGDGWSASPQLWSIGVEEQFYLIWPLVLLILLKKKPKAIPIFLLSFFILYSLLPLLFTNSPINFFDGNYPILHKFFYLNKFNCIAIGALAGFFYFKKSNWTKVLNNNLSLMLLISVILILWGFHYRHSYFTDEIFALLFTLLLIAISASKTWNIDNKLFTFLGKISYGIYMFHWIIISLVLEFLTFNSKDLLSNVLLYALVISLTVFISWLSYEFVEKRFIILKTKYR